MNTNEIVGIGVMILCGVVLVVQILGLLLSIFKKMTTPNVEKLKTRRDKKALIKALRYKDKDVRYAAAEALGRLRWKPAKDETAGWYWMAKRDWDKCVALGALAVEPLIAALKNEEWDVRQVAAYALGEIKDPRAVEPLIAALKDAGWSVRPAAAEALVKIGAPAMEPLIAALKDKDVRASATEALVKIGAPAVEPLIAALKGENKDVRQAAAAMLGRLGWQPGRDETAGWYWMVKGDWDNCVALGSPAVKPLIAALKDKDVRKAAAEALGRLGWEPAQDEMAGWYWMAKRDWDKCVALGALAVEPLIAALKDENSDVRQAAAKALGKIGDPRAVEPLIDALQDKEWFVRRTAAEALISIYRRGGLEDKTKTKILALRDKIAAMHTDEHTDKADCDNHTDIRVRGIEFLL